MMLLKFASHFCRTATHLPSQRLLPVRKFRLSSYQLSSAPLEKDRFLDEKDHPEYGKLRTFYRLPSIANTGLVFNSKYVFIPGYVALLIGEGVAYAYDILDSNDFLPLNLIKLVVLGQLLLINKLFTNLIGFMYVDDDYCLVISYINFWGKRIDEKFDRNELVLHCNENNRFSKFRNKFYVTLLCPVTDRKFKLNLKRCEMNEEILIEFFGALPQTAF